MDTPHTIDNLFATFSRAYFGHRLDLRFADLTFLLIISHA